MIDGYSSQRTHYIASYHEEDNIGVDKQIKQRKQIRNQLSY